MRPCSRTRALVFRSILMAVLLALAPRAVAEASSNSELPEGIQWDALDPAVQIEFRGGATPTDEWGVPHDTVRGYLRKPSGDGPFPAVVLLHNYVVAKFQKQWADRLEDWGYVALLVDSNVRGDATTENRAYDAYGALSYLQRQPYVDAARVGLIGWGTKGGAAVLSALQAESAQKAQPRTIYSTHPSTRFRVGVAFYPFCTKRNFAVYAPALLLAAERDPHAAPGQCARFAGKSADVGAAVRIKIYSGATHLFDAGRDGKDIVGQPYLHDAAATADSVEQVRTMLDAHLK